MNIVILTGRLTKDPEKRSTQNGTATTSFSMAVNRNYKNAEGGYDADFINCVAWRATADFIAKWFKKGSLINIVGSIQTRAYEKDGRKVYVTEVIVDKAEFGGAKGESANNGNDKHTTPIKERYTDIEEVVIPKQTTLDEFADLKPIDDIQLPF